MRGVTRCQTESLVPIVSVVRMRGPLGRCLLHEGGVSSVDEEGHCIPDQLVVNDGVVEDPAAFEEAGAQQRRDHALVAAARGDEEDAAADKR